MNVSAVVVLPVTLSFFLETTSVPPLKIPRQIHSYGSTKGRLQITSLTECTRYSRHGTSIIKNNTIDPRGFFRLLAHLPSATSHSLQLTHFLLCAECPKRYTYTYLRAPDFSHRWTQESGVSCNVDFPFLFCSVLFSFYPFSHERSDLHSSSLPLPLPLPSKKTPLSLASLILIHQLIHFLSPPLPPPLPSVSNHHLITHPSFQSLLYSPSHPIKTPNLLRLD